MKGLVEKLMSYCCGQNSSFLMVRKKNHMKLVYSNRTPFESTGIFVRFVCHPCTFKGHVLRKVNAVLAEGHILAEFLLNQQTSPGFFPCK